MIATLEKNVIMGLIAACVAAGLIAGCIATEKKAPAPGPSENLLRIGVSTNAPPLIYKQNGKIVGLEADFARKFAEYLGKSPYFVELDWDDQIAALLSNRIDIIMSGMTITRLREVRITFSVPYFRSGQMALIQRDDAPRFSLGFFTMTKNSAVGAIKDTTGAYFIETQFARARRVLFESAREGVKALLDRKIDMFIHDAPIILYLASENENNGLTALFKLLTQEDLAWGMRKEDTALRDSANQFLQKLNDEGQLKPMIHYWIPFTD